MSVEKRPNRLEAMGMMALVNPAIKFDSHSRRAMLAHHVDQAPAPAEPDIPRLLTGFESQLKVFDIRMPTNAKVISVHNKYQKGFDNSSIKENSCITVIYQCQTTGKYDVLHITGYNDRHSIYGSQYILTPEIKKLRPDAFIPKDTIFARNPTTKDGGIFSNGLSVNIVKLSLPCTIEDGYGISESLCKRGALLELPVVLGSWGRKTYPLNLYSDNPLIYKPFPDIGDTIREDGLVFAFREYDNNFDALEMSNESLMEVDMVHDIRVYGTPGAYVYDVTVESGIGESNFKQVTSPLMAVQPNNYIKQYSDYFSSILEIYDQVILKDRNARLEPKLMNLITRAYADKPNLVKNTTNIPGIIRRVYKGIPLDEFRVSIHAKKRVPLRMGAKISGFDGNRPIWF